MQRAIILGFLAVFASARAQEKTFYLDSCENFLSADNYSIRRVTKPIPGKLMDVEFEDYDKSGKPITKGLAGSRNGVTKKGAFEYSRADGTLIAKGNFEKGVRTGTWIYFKADGTQTTADELIAEMSTVTFIKDSVAETGRCLCYAKHGYWQSVDLATQDTTINYYEEGKLQTIDGAFVNVDKRPEYRDGMESFYNYLHRKIDYPRISRQKGMQGEAHFSFVVSEKGEVKKVKPLHSVDYATNKAIERALKSTSGRWHPAVRDGNKVAAILVLPVHFKLTRR